MSKIIDEAFATSQDTNRSIYGVMAELDGWNPNDYMILKGHGGAVLSITSTSDNSYVFSGSEDKLVIVWDGNLNIKLKELSGHPGTINVLEVTKDDKTLISGCWEHQIKLWDWMNGHQIGELDGHTGALYCSIMLKTANILVTGSADCFARVWDLNESKLVASCDCSGNPVFGIAMTNDEGILFTGGLDGNIRTWDFTSKTLQSTYKGKSGVIQSMVMTPDSKFLIFGTRNNVIKVLKWPGLSEYSIYTSHSGCIQKLVCTADSTYFISASADRSVRIFNLIEKSEEFIFDENEGIVFGLHLSGDETLMYTGASDKCIRKKVLAIKHKAKILKGHQNAVMCLAISNDNRYIVSGSEDKTLIVWDIQTEEVKFTLTGHRKTIWSVAISSDMEYIASVSADKTLRLWDFLGNALVTLTGHKQQIFTVAINRTSTLIATGAQDKLLGLYDAQNRTLVKFLEGHTDTILSVKFTSTGETLLSGAADYTVRIWDVKNLVLFEKIDTKSGVIESLCITKDNKYVIIGDRKNFVHLWDWEERKVIKKFAYHTKWVKCVTLSNEDKLFASCSSDSTIKMYSLIDKRKEMNFIGHSNTIRSIAFSNNQQFLVSASEDHTVRIWDLQEQAILNICDTNSMCESFLFFNAIYNGKGLNKEFCARTFSSLRINLVHMYCYKGNHELLKIVLESGASIKTDVLMNSPLTYALDRNSQNCVDVILSFLNELKVNNVEQFVEFSLGLKNDFSRLLKNKSIYLQPFLNNLLVTSTQTDLPKFGKPLHVLPHAEFSDNLKIYKELFLSSEFSSSEEEKDVEFKIFPFKIDVISGSRGSLILLNSIYKCPNRSIYSAYIIQILVKTKWKAFWFFILLLTSLNWLNIGLMIAILIDDANNQYLIFTYGIVNIILFIYEIVQAFSIGIVEYLKFWNVIDICRCCLCLTWTVIYFNSHIGDTYNYLSFVMVIFNFLRGLSGFRAFNKTRFYVRLISTATKEATPFIIIFFYTTLSFGMLNWSSGREYRKDGFSGLWKVPFELNMGNFNNSDVLDLNYTFFMFASVINVIIILNLLISILGDSYDKFQAEAIQIGTLEQIELIIEIETIMFWRRDSGQLKYILICDETNFEGGNDEWAGKLKAINDVINKNHNSTKKTLDYLVKTVEDMKKLLSKK